MKSLKEISNIFVSNLAEGLLDDIEDTMSDGNDMMDEELIKSWAISKDCKVRKTKQGFKLEGNFVIKDIKDEYYTGPMIKSVKGNLSIDSTELIDLRNMFAVDCEITGTFSVENNKKLNSLFGCPLQVQTLVISGNKSLKTIDMAPTTMMNAYINKNGFKSDKEELSKELQVFKHIYCSVNNEDELINESLLFEAIKAPQLKPIIKAVQQFNKIKEYKGKDNVTATMSSIFSEAPWDKITSSQISEYEPSDPQCIKLARKWISKRAEDYSTLGVIFLLNAAGEVTGAIVQNYYYSLNPNSRSYIWQNKTNDKYNISKNYFKKINDLLTFIEEADTVIFIEFTPGQSREIIDLKLKRAKEKQGAIALQRGYELKGRAENTIRLDNEKLLDRSWYSRDSFDTPDIKQVRYYQDIVEENRARYKKMIEKIKAQKASMTSNFTSIKKRIDDVFMRYTTLLDKVIKDPAKYSKENWVISKLQEHFSTLETQGNGTHKYSTEYGLMKMLKLYTDAILSAAQGYTYIKDLYGTLKNIEDTINKEIDTIDNTLKTLEAL